MYIPEIRRLSTLEDALEENFRGDECFRKKGALINSALIIASVSQSVTLSHARSLAPDPSNGSEHLE